VPSIATFVRGTFGMDAATVGGGQIGIARAADDPATTDDNAVGENVFAGSQSGSPTFAACAPFEVPVNARNIAVRMWLNGGSAAKYRLDVSGFRW
jgi:hypothetical protein